MSLDSRYIDNLLKLYQINDMCSVKSKLHKNKKSDIDLFEKGPIANSTVSIIGNITFYKANII